MDNFMNYMPKPPFVGYKWRWASKQPTEGLNDPAILLGLLPRLAALEDIQVKYSSPEFASELGKLDRDIGGTTVSLASRVGKRNLMRNSGQYWRVLNLIPTGGHGVIRLTPLGRKIAERQVSQAEFIALTINSFQLPNPVTYSPEEVTMWESNEIVIKPLRLILEILLSLNNISQEYITTNEIARVVIPMAGDRRSAEEISEYLKVYRQDPCIVAGWPTYHDESNDLRIIREFLLFLHNFEYLYVDKKDHSRVASRFDKRFYLTPDIVSDLRLIVDHSWSFGISPQGVMDERLSDAALGVENSVFSQRNARPLQAQFRRSLLEVAERCFITGVDMKEVVEAAHIKPHKYGGGESVQNGLLLRADIHKLYDTGHLSIAPDGEIVLSERAKNNYRYLIGKVASIPNYVDREMLRWRHENRFLGLPVDTL